jgi:hypothetical protein
VFPSAATGTMHVFLLCLYWAAFIYHVVVLVVEFYEYRYDMFVYMTVWSYILLTISLGLEGLGIKFRLLYSLAFVASYVVTLGFYSMEPDLVGRSPVVVWLTVSMHGLNTVVATAFFVMNSHFVYLNDGLLVAMYGVVYFAFMVSRYFESDNWVYEALNWSDWSVLMSYTGIITAALISFAFVYVLSIVKYVTWGTCACVGFSARGVPTQRMPWALAKIYKHYDNDEEGKGKGKDKDKGKGKKGDKRRRKDDGSRPRPRRGDLEEGYAELVAAPVHAPSSSRGATVGSQARLAKHSRDVAAQARRARSAGR